MENRRNILAGLLGLGGLAAVAKADTTEGVAEETATPDVSANAVYTSGLRLFFAFRDTVIRFDTTNGIGAHIGTVEGAITGTSITNFQFIPTSQTTIVFDNRCLISDIDGDQIIFRVVGNGRFIIPPPTDTTSPLGNLAGIGGPLIATMTALQGTGKYSFLVGRKFPCKMIATNAATPAIGTIGGVLGNVYGEVYSDTVGVF
ncbi:MAG: hypothetical protein ABL967_07525 [Bryobacteraceae bacterium]